MFCDIKEDSLDEKSFLSERRSHGNELCEISDKIREAGAPFISEGYLLMDEEKKVRPTSNREAWFEAIKSVFEFNQILVSRKCAIEESLGILLDQTIALAKCFPAEYDQKMFEGAWLYQGKWILKSNHWGFSRATEDNKETLKADYDKCKNLFQVVTEGLVPHNFTVCVFEDLRYGEFDFTIEGVPGKFEITFPTPIAQYGVKAIGCGLEHLPFLMHLTWRFHDIIPVLDHFWGHTYHLEDVNKSLREFVEKKTWREIIKERRCKDGVMEEWLEAEIKKSIAKASVEKNSASKQE